MTSFVDGMQATFGAAFSDIFHAATLTRGTDSYSIKALVETYGETIIAATLTPTHLYQVMVLGLGLQVEPEIGDVVTMNAGPFAGKSMTVSSGSISAPAVSADPAKAVWTLRMRPISSTSTGDDAGTSTGLTYSQYRPAAALVPPIVSANLIGPIVALMTVQKTAFNLQRAPFESDFFWYASVDPSTVRVGDFLVGGETFYIANIEHLLPVLAVECNAVVSVNRAPASAQDGNVGYIGITNANVAAAPIASAIPACIIGESVGNSRRNDGKIAADAPGPNRWTIYVPPVVFPRGSVQDRDVIIDDLGNRYQIASAYWSQIGYKCECIKLEA